MAKVEFSIPFLESVSGSIGNLTFRTVNGNTYAFERKPKPVKKVTAAQLKSRENFRLISQRVKTVLNSVPLRVPYEIEWEHIPEKRRPPFRHWLSSKIAEEMRQNNSLI